MSKTSKINPDVLANLEMSMRSNELEGHVYTDEEKELFRSACTSEENLEKVINEYVARKLDIPVKALER